ncbi:MAG: hypothetical protein EOP67_55160 [Sphingomonas sp.]|nr:MAG: hypothetical protein EOP67_55160 [Sphingomonas sp.]
MPAHLLAIASATPPLDVHRDFIDWATARVRPDREPLFRRMAERAGIERRWSVLASPGGGSPVAPGGFYETMPGTAVRMARYAEAAPELALAAVDALAAKRPLGTITQLATTRWVIVPNGRLAASASTAASASSGAASAYRAIRTAVPGMVS